MSSSKTASIQRYRFSIFADNNGVAVVDPIKNSRGEWARYEDVARLEQCHREGWRHAQEVEDEYRKRMGHGFGTPHETASAKTDLAIRALRAIQQHGRNSAVGKTLMLMEADQALHLIDSLPDETAAAPSREEALVEIERHKRRVEILCDHFGMDPAEFVITRDETAHHQLCRSLVKHDCDCHTLKASEPQLQGYKCKCGEWMLYGRGHRNCPAEKTDSQRLLDAGFERIRRPLPNDDPKCSHCGGIGEVTDGDKSWRPCPKCSADPRSPANE